MAAFNWGNNLKAPLPYDGQPYVDDAGHVWQWRTAEGAWLRANYLELRRVREMAILCAGSNAMSADIFQTSRRSGTIGDIWDEVYALSFVEVWSVDGSTCFGRRAQMNLADFSAWCRSVIPNDGFMYSENAVLHVYEVFDTRQFLTRWNVWNGIYGSFRGRDCYYGARGYGRTYPAQGSHAGAGLGFNTFHGVSLVERLMNYFYGLTPGSLEERACWSAGNKKTTHRTPSSANGIIMRTNSLGGTPNRYCWDWGSSDWAVAPMGEWEIFTDGLLNQNPCAIGRGVDTPNLIRFTQPRDSLLGLGALWDNDINAKEGMLAYCIRSVADHNFVAFLIKPIGITKCAFAAAGGVSPATHHVMAVGRTKGRAGYARVIDATSRSLVQDRGHEGFRISDLIMTIAHLRAYHSSMSWMCASVDGDVIPDDIYFYTRHAVSGVRSPEFSSHIHVDRRKNGMPVSLVGVR